MGRFSASRVALTSFMLMSTVFGQVVQPTQPLVNQTTLPIPATTNFPTTSVPTTVPSTIIPVSTVPSTTVPSTTVPVVSTPVILNQTQTNPLMTTPVVAPSATNQTLNASTPISSLIPTPTAGSTSIFPAVPTSTITVPTSLPSNTYTLFGTSQYTGQYQARVTPMSAASNDLWRIEVLLPAKVSLIQGAAPSNANASALPSAASVDMVEAHLVVQNGYNGPLVQPKVYAATTGSSTMLTAGYTPITNTFGLQSYIPANDVALQYSVKNQQNVTLLTALIDSDSTTSVQLNWLMTQVNDQGHWTLDYIPLQPSLNQTLYFYFTVHAQGVVGLDTPWTPFTPTQAVQAIQQPTNQAGSLIVDTTKSSPIIGEPAFQWQPLVVLVPASTTGPAPQLPGQQTTQASVVPNTNYNIVVNTNRSAVFLWLNVDYQLNNQPVARASMTQQTATQWIHPITLKTSDFLVYNFTYWSLIDNQQHMVAQWYVYQMPNSDATALAAAVARGTGTTGGYVIGSGQSLWSALESSIAASVTSGQSTGPLPGGAGPVGGIGGIGGIGGLGGLGGIGGLGGVGGLSPTASSTLSNAASAILSGLSSLGIGPVQTVNNVGGMSVSSLSTPQSITNIDATTHKVTAQSAGQTGELQINDLSSFVTPLSMVLNLAGTSSSPSPFSTIMSYMGSALCVVPCNSDNSTFNAMTTCLGSCVQNSGMMPQGMNAMQGAAVVNSLHDWLIQVVPGAADASLSPLPMSFPSASTPSASVPTTTVPTSTIPTTTIPMTAAPAAAAASSSTEGASSIAAPAASAVEPVAPVDNTVAPAASAVAPQAAADVAPAASTAAPEVAATVPEVSAAQSSPSAGTVDIQLPSAQQTGNIPTSTGLITALSNAGNSLPLSALSWLLQPIFPSSTISAAGNTAKVYTSSFTCLLPCADSSNMQDSAQCVVSCTSALLPSTTAAQTQSLVDSLNTIIASATAVPATDAATNQTNGTSTPNSTISEPYGSDNSTMTGPDTNSNYSTVAEPVVPTNSTSSPYMNSTSSPYMNSSSSTVAAVEPVIAPAATPVTSTEPATEPAAVSTTPVAMPVAEPTTASVAPAEPISTVPAVSEVETSPVVAAVPAETEAASSAPVVPVESVSIVAPAETAAVSSAPVVSEPVATEVPAVAAPVAEPVTPVVPAVTPAASEIPVVVVVPAVEPVASSSEPAISSSEPSTISADLVSTTMQPVQSSGEMNTMQANTVSITQISNMPTAAAPASQNAPSMMFAAGPGLPSQPSAGPSVNNVGAPQQMDSMPRPPVMGSNMPNMPPGMNGAPSAMSAPTGLSVNSAANVISSTTNALANLAGVDPAIVQPIIQFATPIANAGSTFAASIAPPVATSNYTGANNGSESSTEAYVDPVLSSGNSTNSTAHSNNSTSNSTTTYQPSTVPVPRAMANAFVSTSESLARLIGIPTSSLQPVVALTNAGADAISSMNTPGSVSTQGIEQPVFSGASNFITTAAGSIASIAGINPSVIQPFVSIANSGANALNSMPAPGQQQTTVQSFTTPAAAANFLTTTTQALGGIAGVSPSTLSSVTNAINVGSAFVAVASPSSSATGSSMPSMPTAPTSAPGASVTPSSSSTMPMPGSQSTVSNSASMPSMNMPSGGPSNPSASSAPSGNNGPSSSMTPPSAHSGNNGPSSSMTPPSRSQSGVPDIRSLISGSPVEITKEPIVGSKGE